MNEGIIGRTFGDFKESESVDNYLVGYRTIPQVISEFYGIREEDFKNIEELKRCKVVYTERLNEIKGLTKEMFDRYIPKFTFDPNEYEQKLRDNDISTKGAEKGQELQNTDKRTRKGRKGNGNDSDI